jgi:hypothetical protein
VLVVALYGVSSLRRDGHQAVAVGEELAAVPQVQGLGDAATDGPEGVELPRRPPRRGALRENVGMERMKHREAPRWWTAVGVIGALLGLAFWVAVAVVAWHFIGKYW